MPDQADVIRIAQELPETTIGSTGHSTFQVAVAGKRFASIYPEKVHPKKPRVPNPDGLVVQVEDEQRKFTLIESNPEVYFTTDHYNGYPAVILWLSKIDLEDLRDLLIDAWYIRAPKHLQQAWDQRMDTT